MKKKTHRTIFIAVFLIVGLFFIQKTVLKDTPVKKQSADFVQNNLTNNSINNHHLGSRFYPETEERPTHTGTIINDLTLNDENIVFTDSGGSQHYSSDDEYHCAPDASYDAVNKKDDCYYSNAVTDGSTKNSQHADGFASGGNKHYAMNSGSQGSSIGRNRKHTGNHTASGLPGVGGAGGGSGGWGRNHDPLSEKNIPTDTTSDQATIALNSFHPEKGKVSGLIHDRTDSVSKEADRNRTSPSGGKGQNIPNNQTNNKHDDRNTGASKSKTAQDSAEEGNQRRNASNTIPPSKLNDNTGKNGINPASHPPTNTSQSKPEDGETKNNAADGIDNPSSDVASPENDDKEDSMGLYFYGDPGSAAIPDHPSNDTSINNKDYVENNNQFQQKVSEPASIFLFGLGCMTLWWLRRRHGNNAIK